MATRRRAKEERRALRAAQERAEREARRRRDLMRILVAGAMLIVFAGVLLGSVLIGGGSSEDGSEVSASSSATAPPSSLGKITGPQGVDVGESFPDFRLTEAGGERVTPESLRGKPAVVWFTTSYCVPCQVGATKVGPLDDELGGDAFNVLVVFVDPSEPTSALTSWREEFGNEDWMVAIDEKNALAKEVELRFLDSKFLLDPGGRIEDVDLEIVDDEYLERLREAAT